MNNEEETMWKEAIIVYFNVLSQYLSGGIDKCHEHLVKFFGGRAEIRI
jgi:hypothetical protein